MYNLKDAKNELAIKVLNKQMSPKELVLKEASELASDSQKAEKQAVLEDHLAAARTDLGFEL